MNTLERQNAMTPEEVEKLAQLIKNHQTNTNLKLQKPRGV